METSRKKAIIPINAKKRKRKIMIKKVLNKREAKKVMKMLHFGDIAQSNQIDPNGYESSFASGKQIKRVLMHPWSLAFSGKQKKFYRTLKNNKIYNSVVWLNASTEYNKVYDPSNY